MLKNRLKPHIVIPIAGLGTRMMPITGGGPKMFYRPTGEKTLLEMALEGLLKIFPKSIWSFIVLQEHIQDMEFEKYCHHILPDAEAIRVVALPKPTHGQLATVMNALDSPATRSLIIHNCDTFVRFKNFKVESISEWDFIVPVFKSASPAYSYCDVDKTTGLILDVKEKIPLESNLASSGTYIFSDERKFVDAAKAVLERKLAGATTEYYVSLVLQEMVNTGMRGSTIELDECIPLGTPEEIGYARATWSEFANVSSGAERNPNKAGSSGATIYPRQGLMIKMDRAMGAIRIKQQGFWYWSLEPEVSDKFPSIVGFEWSPTTAHLQMEHLSARVLSELLLDDSTAGIRAHILRDVLNFLSRSLYKEKFTHKAQEFWNGLCGQTLHRLEQISHLMDTEIGNALKTPVLNGKIIPTAHELIKTVSEITCDLQETTFVRAHGDVHTGNILVSTDAVRLIDPRGLFSDGSSITSHIYDLGKILHDLHGGYSLIRAGMYKLLVEENQSLNFHFEKNQAYENYRSLLWTFKDWATEGGTNAADLSGAFLAEGLLMLGIIPFHAKYGNRGAAFAVVGRIVINKWIHWYISNEKIENLFSELDS